MGRAAATAARAARVGENFLIWSKDFYLHVATTQHVAEDDTYLLVFDNISSYSFVSAYLGAQ